MRKTEIVIRIGLPNWSRARWVLIAVVVGLLAGTVAYATGTYPLMLPTNFNSTTTLSSTTFNTAFGQVNSDVNDLNMRVAALETKSLGTFCGLSSTMYMGNLGGYAGAKTKCMTTVGTCNAATVHMCASQELIAFAANGGLVPRSAWYAAGIGSQVGSSVVANDCQAWSGAQLSQYGPIYDGSGNPNLETCNMPHAVACCN